MSTPKDNDTQAITDFNEALRRQVTHTEHVNAKGVNDATTDSTQADSTPDKAALAAGGNSSGGARADGDAPFADSSTDGLLLSATDLLALVELEPLNTEESTKMLQILGTYHHAIFSRRVDTVAQAACRDKFHERLHALRHQVVEAQRVAQEDRESRERHATPAPAPAPQPMGGVVDAAVKVMREEWRADVTHTNNIVQSLVIEMGQLRGRSMRLVERIAALEAAQKQAHFDAQVQSARIDVWGSTTMQMLLKESDVTHITSEAEMVEAFGEGRGQAMWAECEARKSGGAK